jgi:hypothetical protein
MIVLYLPAEQDLYDQTQVSFRTLGPSGAAHRRRWRRRAELCSLSAPDQLRTARA